MACLAVIVLVACGDADSGSGTPDPPVDVAMVGPVDAGATVSDWLVPGFQPGFWTASTEDDVTVLRMSRGIGDEDGESWVLRFRDNDDGLPELLDGTHRWTSWDGETSVFEEYFVAGRVTIQSWDPDGVLAGLIEWDAPPAYRRPQREFTFPFWVEPGLATTQGRPGDLVSVEAGSAVEIGVPLVQFVGVVEDSRCPADVTCVWEGRVVTRWQVVGETVVTIDVEGVIGGEGMGVGVAAPSDFESYTIEVREVDATTDRAVALVTIGS